MPTGPSTMLRTGTPTLEKPKIPRGPIEPRGGGGSPGPFGPGDSAAVPPVSPARIGVWLLVAAITILFAAFTSTYLVRRGEADWRVGPLPPVLWVNTAVILLSSASMEWARVWGRRGRIEMLRSALAVTTVLGVGFLAGQLLAWRQLVASGIYVATNPHSSFFYLLTGAHGVHLVGGLSALCYALWKVRRTPSPEEALAVADPTATYWHFLTGLWVYLFFILFWI